MCNMSEPELKSNCKGGRNSVVFVSLRVNELLQSAKLFLSVVRLNILNALILDDCACYCRILFCIFRNTV